MEFRRERNYSSVGFDFMASGGQGGAFNASREVWEFGLKHWSGLSCVSFGLSLVCLGVIKL